MKQQQDIQTKKQIIRISGKLKEIVTIHDEKGNILQKIISPIMVEFYLRDLIQVIVGATLLAIPLAYTEEVWRMGASLPINNIIGIAALSLLFVSLFVYYNFYKENLKKHILEFIKRVLSIYITSFLVVFVVLFLIDQVSWETQATLIVSIKRIVLIAFPASLSATVADMIK